jgi:hypothetical protein
VRGFVLDIGTGHRSDAVASARLLSVRHQATSRAKIKLRVLTDVDRFKGLDYEGDIDLLLAEFQNSNMLGFIVDFEVGWILVASPSLHYTRLPYFQIVSPSGDQWDESLLDELMKNPGIYYAVISVEETLDLEDLEHVDKDNFPWGHWR